MALSGTADGRPLAVALRALGLGDILTAVPALRALRGALPEHRILLLAPPRWRSLIPLLDAVDGLVPVDGVDRPLVAPHPQIDVAVNLHGKGPQSHAALAGLRPQCMVGYACAPWIEPGPRAPAWPETAHERERWCRLIAAAFEVAADPGDLLIRAPEPQADARFPLPGYVLLHPGAASPARRWPLERFARVGRWLADQQLRIVVTAGPGEARLGSELAAAIGGSARCMQPGDAADLAAVVAGARLVLCGDTGVAHLASALARPSIVLFGPVSPALWGPPPTGPHSVLWHGDGGGDPHAQSPDPALLRIEADDAIEACARGLDLPEI